MKTRTRLIAVVTATIALVFAGVAPAFADHDAGVEGNDHCEYGTLLSGGPSTTLYTTNFTSVHSRGSLLVVCHFTVPLFVPATDCATCYPDKGDWTAPSRPKTYPVYECYAPGTDLAGQTQPNGEGARPSERASIVFYRTHAVLTCFWKDDPTNDPGYYDPPVYEVSTTSE